MQNKASQLIESIENLFETNPFHHLGGGYSIDKHFYPSPQQKEEIFSHETKSFGPKRHSLKNLKKRILTVHTHDGEHYGVISHTSEHGHPLDTHYYKLIKRKRK